MRVRFLLLEQVVKIHQDQINSFGGTNGIRDIGLLLSAINVPGATFDGKFLHETVYEMAAAYLFHIVKNHPFVDGNKRVGTSVALTFLDINGYSFDAPQEDLLTTVLLVAQGKLGKSELTIFIQKWSAKNDN